MRSGVHVGALWATLGWDHRELRPNDDDPAASNTGFWQRQRLLDRWFVEFVADAEGHGIGPSLEGRPQVCDRRCP